MSKGFFTWNPQGLQRLSFRDFKLLPNSSSQHLAAATAASLLVVLAAGLATYIVQYIPIPNINILFNILIAFLIADRVHPHPIVGPLIITLPIVGIIWLLFILVPDTLPLGQSFILTIAANLFTSLVAGALLAVVFKAQKEASPKE